MRLVDHILAQEKDLETILRSRWYFVSPKNRHRVKKTRNSAFYIMIKEGDATD